MPEGSSVLRQMFRFGWDSCNKLYPEHQRFVEAVALDLGCVCCFSHGRMLNPYTQMQKRFAGIKPSCDVRNPMTQTIKLLTIATRSPIHDFRASSNVASTVRKHER